MENIRIILYLSLFFTLFLLWERWTEWQQPPDSAVSVRADARNAGNTGEYYGSEDNQDQEIPSLPETAVESANQPAALSGMEQNAGIAVLDRPPLIEVETDVVRVFINPRGGTIERLELLQYPVSSSEPDTPFKLLQSNADTTYHVQSGLLSQASERLSDSAQKMAPDHRSVFTYSKSHYQLDDRDRLDVVLKWENKDGISVTKTYTFYRSSYLVVVNHQLDNRSTHLWTGRQYQQIKHSAVDQNAVRIIYTFTGAAYFDGKFNKLSFDDMQDSRLNQVVAGGWVSMLQHYFVSALIPANQEEKNHFYTLRNTNSNEYIIGMSSPPRAIDTGQSGEFSANVYMGPKLQNRLSKIAPGLELVADYGIFTVIAEPLFWLLDKIHNYTGNWGVAIILLTVLIKLLFYKLSEASFKSMAKMREFQPQLMAIRSKYAGEKSKLNQEMMSLYKKEKINPLGGCLPVLVQIPVFIALYWVLLESVELRQATFVLWIKDLSVRDPYFVLPLIMGISMFIQTKMNPAPLDPLQAKIMLALPIIFTFFFAFFPSGLVLYWCVNNLLSILQQYIINRRIGGKSRR